MTVKEYTNGPDILSVPPYDKVTLIFSNKITFIKFSTGNGLKMIQYAISLEVSGKLPSMMTLT